MKRLPLVRVVRQQRVADGLFRLTFASPSPLLPSGSQPGQFFHIRPSDNWDLLLRRPLSLCLADVERNEVTVLYRAAGAGTLRLSRLQAGDSIDVLGPLGRGFPIVSGDRLALLIGGGIGVPPLVELAKALAGAGTRVLSLVGFQTRSQAVLTDELGAYGDVAVATDDGSLGHRGRVTELLTRERCQGVDRYYACGPTPMLSAVKEAMAAERAPGYLSLEERMGCGTGLCAACVHKIARDGRISNLKTCREGPVFPADEVMFG